MKFEKIDAPKKEEGSSRFVRLKAGESITGVFRGEVYKFYSKFENDKYSITTKDDPKGRMRFRLNFVTKDGNQMVAKIFEFGVTVNNQLHELSQEWALETTKVKISRHGSGLDTLYMIMPIAKEPLSAKQLQELSKLPLNLLEVKPQAKEPQERSFDDSPVFSDIPGFDEAPGYDDDSKIPF